MKKPIFLLYVDNLAIKTFRLYIYGISTICGLYFSNTYWRFRCFVKFIIADLSGIIFFLNCIDYFKNNVYNYYV